MSSEAAYVRATAEKISDRAAYIKAACNQYGDSGYLEELADLVAQLAELVKELA